MWVSWALIRELFVLCLSEYFDILVLFYQSSLYTPGLTALNAAKSKTTMITMKEISIWCLVVVILVSSKQINGQCGDNNQYCEPDTCCPLHDTCCDMAGSPNGKGCCPIENVRKSDLLHQVVMTCHCQNSTSHIVPQTVMTYLTICLRNTFYSLFVGSLLRRWALLLLPRI